MTQASTHCLAGKGTDLARTDCFLESVKMIVTRSVEFVPAILMKYLIANNFFQKKWNAAIDEDGMLLACRPSV